MNNRQRQYKDSWLQVTIALIGIVGGLIAIIYNALYL
jgi:hypothetical protein